MPPVLFDEYRFDPSSLELTYRGTPLRLRPKTAVILRRLLADPGDLVEKPVLLEAALGGRWVADQNLFQAISELRSVFAPLKPIVTYPNRGYAWTLPVRSPAANPAQGILRRWTAGKLAAVMTGAMAGVMAATALMISLPGHPDSRLPLAPSIQAFQLGISTLDSEPDRAADLFRLALKEDPDFAEAQLMLAQSLYLSGLLDQARAEAQHLYLKAVDAELGYLQVNVMGLLSRLDEATGQPDPAFDWAKSAWEKARDEGFACAASEARRRLVDLLAETEESEDRLPQVFQQNQQSDAALAEQNPSAGCDPLLGVSDPFGSADSASELSAGGRLTAV